MDITNKNIITFSFIKLEVLATLEKMDMGGWVVNLGQVNCKIFADSEWVF